MTPVHVSRARWALTALAVALGLAAALAWSPSARPAPAPRVVLVTNNCDALNFICPGFIAALRRTGVEGRVISPDPREDPEATIGLLARGGYDMVITDPFWDGVLSEVAPRHPDVHFGIVDGRPVDASRNVQGVVLQPGEASFMAGWLAARMEQRRPGRDVVGVVAGMPAPSVLAFVLAFRRGARYASPGVRLLTGYSGDFTDPDKCAAVARSQIARGAGVVFDVAGACGSGTLEAARAAGIMAVGVDRDRSALGPFVLTSVVKRYDRATEYLLRQVKEGRFRRGVREMGLRRGGTGLGRLSPRVPDDLRAELAALRARILARGLPPER